MWHGKKKRTAKEAGKMGDALLTIKNLSAWYSNEKRILSDFSFALDEHEVAGLIGLNGAGKTTFLKVLSGLLPTFRSEGIFFCSAPVDFRKQDFKRCRYTVFAEDNSFSYFTFWEYLAYVCAAYGKEVYRYPVTGAVNRKPEKGILDYGFCPETQIASFGRAGQWAGFPKYGIPISADFGV